MKNSLSVPLTKHETVRGICYLLIEFAIIPVLLQIFNAMLHRPMNDAMLNFVFYGINFSAIIWIFRGFLRKNLYNFFRFPGYCLWVVLIGLAQYTLFTQFISYIVWYLDPGYANANDANIRWMVASNPGLMTLATVVLVPPAEECLFRGLIFRNLYEKSVPLAWAASIAGFAAIHVMGYVGVLTPTELLISLLQYVPAGISLAWAYVRTDSIVTPILIHAIVNAMGIYSMR